MKENRFHYEQPMMDVVDFHKYAIFTLNASAEYDADKEDDVPSIDDIIRTQQW